MAWYSASERREVTRHRTPMAGYRAVVLHVAANEAETLYRYFARNEKPTSHFYVRYDGAVEQYVDTRYQAPAQLEGNSTCLGVETQGLEPGSWTAAQVESLAMLCAWASETHGVPLREMLSSDPSERGIAPHRLGVDPWRVPGGERWSRFEGKTCPGNGRIFQMPDVVVAALTRSKGTPPESSAS